MGLPLEAIRVIEFAPMVRGPTCGRVLADPGAEASRGASEYARYSPSSAARVGTSWRRMRRAECW